MSIDYYVTQKYLFLSQFIDFGYTIFVSYLCK